MILYILILLLVSLILSIYSLSKSNNKKNNGPSGPSPSPSPQNKDYKGIACPPSTKFTVTGKIGDDGFVCSKGNPDQTESSCKSDKTMQQMPDTEIQGMKYCNFPFNPNQTMRFCQGVSGGVPEGADIPCILPPKNSSAAEIASQNESKYLSGPHGILAWENANTELTQMWRSNLNWSTNFADSSEHPSQDQWNDGIGGWLKSQYNGEYLPPDVKIINRGWTVTPLFICKTCGSQDCCTIEKGCKDCQLCPKDGCVKDKMFLKEVIWKRSDFDSNDIMGCCYGDDGEYYGGPYNCTKNMCLNHNGQWKELSFNNEKLDDISKPCNGPSDTIILNNSSDIHNFEQKLESTDKNDNFILKQNWSPPNFNDDLNKLQKVIIKDTTGYKYKYTRISIVPYDFGCRDFPKWTDNNNKKLYNQCITNCKKQIIPGQLAYIDPNSDSLHSCEKRCLPYDLNKIDQEFIPASSTNFAFGGITACFCNGPNITSSLIELDTPYIGIAAPSWLGTPFSTNQPGQPITGADSIATRYGDGFTTNCAAGEGGCGKCFEIRIDHNWDKDSDNNQDNPNSSKVGGIVHGVVLDSCEDSNVYGNNWNWCTSQRADTPSKIYSNPSDMYNINYEGHYPNFFKNIPIANTTTLNSNNNMTWSSPDCMNDKNEFICKNMNYYPVHIDAAIQRLSPSQLAKIPLKKDNPKVSIKKIDCPKNVIDILKNNCGQKNSGAPQSETLNRYCPGHKTDQVKNWINI